MIIEGDCLEVMKTFPDNHFSGIVTDPPYGLKFMGKSWDHGIPGTPFWVEMLRVCKPGSHLLAFGGTRTYHRLTCAIEDAGWEIRDCLMWVYGSGFPKSHNISKGIDKAKANSQDIIKVCEWMRNRCCDLGITKNQLDECAGTSDMGGWWISKLPHRSAIPTLEQWYKLSSILGNCPQWMQALIKPANQWGDAAFKRGIIETTGGLHGGSGNTVGCFTGKQISDNPILDLAKEFEGYGTALKPAYEPIIMAMKPCDGTFKQNAEKWGQAGINIDGCRIPTTDKFTHGANKGISSMKEGWDRPWKHSPEMRAKCTERAALQCEKSQTLGRWPANIIFDEEAGKILDEQNLASRFFYCAKASSRERNEGLEDFPYIECQTGCGGSMSIDDRGKIRDRFRKIAKNTHPTVKPQSLLRYLIQLISPPKDSLILDPFAGSGSTICAAIQLGIMAVGIEKDHDYAEISKRRVEHSRMSEKEPPKSSRKTKVMQPSRSQQITIRQLRFF